MRKLGKFMAAGNAGMVGIALLTVLAVLVAPICAPLCAVASCMEGSSISNAHTQCHKMAMHEHGFSLDAKNAPICGNGELQATLNGNRDKEAFRESSQAGSTADDSSSTQEISSLIESRQSPHGLSREANPIQSSSSLTVLRI